MDTYKAPGHLLKEHPPHRRDQHPCTDIAGLKAGNPLTNGISVRGELKTLAQAQNFPPFFDSFQNPHTSIATFKYYIQRLFRSLAPSLITLHGTSSITLLISWPTASGFNRQHPDVRREVHMGIIVQNRKSVCT